MRILILYSIFSKDPRRTIEDHIYSFARYKPRKDIEIFYCDVIFNLPIFLRWFKWDGIIIHYSLAAWRTTVDEWRIIFPQLKRLKKIQACKILIPQDEYSDTAELWKIIQECGIDTVFTCAYPEDYPTLYPKEKTGLKHLFTTLTGFVDEETLKQIKLLSNEIKERPIDIGYRARKLPYWVGYFGQLKHMIAEAVLSCPYKKNLKLDISTNLQDVFHGDEWYRFLLSSRTMLGCLGGSSMIDETGQIRVKVNEFVEKNPDLTFKEVEAICFPGKDNSISLFAISPRHFECAMTKTCQILLEGNYLGIFKPGIHYIELKKDFSNLQDVMEKVAGKEYCRQIAENAYRDIVESGKYTYRKFATTVINHIQSEISSKKSSKRFFIGGNILKSLFHFRFKLRELRLRAADIWLRNLPRLNKLIKFYD